MPSRPLRLGVETSIHLLLPVLLFLLVIVGDICGIFFYPKIFKAKTVYLLVSSFDQHLKVEVAHYYARNFRHMCRKHAGIDYFLDFVPLLRPSQNMQEG
jgi:hypothetical protein